MGVYDRQIATARRLILRYGQPCLWRVPGQPVGGTAAAPGPVGDPVDFAVPIVFLSNKSRESLAGLLAMITDTEVPTSGMGGLMPAVPFQPRLTHVVFKGPDETAPRLHLMDKNGIDLVAPNGEPILYFLRFQR